MKKFILLTLVLCFILTSNTTVIFAYSEYTQEVTTSVIHLSDNTIDGQFKSIIRGNTKVDANGKVKFTEPMRVKSVGKNLIPPFTKWKLPKETKIIDPYKISFTANKDTLLPQFFVSPKIPIKGGCTYTLSATQFPSTDLVWIDENTEFISENYNTQTATAPLNAKYVYAIYYVNSIGNHIIEMPQLEYGDKATSFEEYKESTQYIEETLRRLPNGISDEINDGNLIKRCGNAILDENKNWVFNHNLGDYKQVATPNVGCNDFSSILIKDNGLKLHRDMINAPLGNGDAYNNGHYDNGTIWVTLNNSNTGWSEDYVPTQQDIKNYFDKHPYILIYQLDKPQIHNLNTSPITVFKNGTVLIENVIKNIEIYDEGISISNKKIPIKFIESVYKFEGNVKTQVDLDNVKVATNGLTFTIEGAKSGDRYEYVYKYDSSLSAIPTIKYTVPTDEDAQINNIIEINNKQSELINDLQERIEALESGNRASSDVKTIEYQYDDNGSLIRRIQQ